MIDSFRHAIDGIKSSFLEERNMKIHFIIMLIVILLGFLLKVTIFEWMILVLLFMLVIGSELINTAIENTVDLAVSKYDEKAKLAKDISAGAVLFMALGSIIIGSIIFIPKILDFIDIL